MYHDSNLLQFISSLANLLVLLLHRLLLFLLLLLTFFDVVGNSVAFKYVDVAIAAAIIVANASMTAVVLL